VKGEDDVVGETADGKGETADGKGEMEREGRKNVRSRYCLVLRLIQWRELLLRRHITRLLSGKNDKAIIGVAIVFEEAKKKKNNIKTIHQTNHTTTS
jgi:hypothetical protein